MTAIADKRIDIRTIRKMMAEGASVAQVAKKYGVSKQAIYQRLRLDDLKNQGRNTSGFNESQIRTSIDTAVDPETGAVVALSRKNKALMATMGDEKVTRFVDYHMEMLAMRQGVDKNDVRDLNDRFVRYLAYCRDHGVIPNNMNCYYAIGVTRDNISRWKLGKQGTPAHKEFAEMVTSFFASIHEQGAADGVLNPISSIFWQKAHDGLSDQPKIEVQLNDPLGEKRSAADIAKAYEDVELPD